MAGKNINLFLMDGSVEGRVKCSLSNWTGLVYKIPRQSFSICDSIKEMHNNGIYFMVGVNDKTDQPAVYVGQARQRKNGGGLMGRIAEPHHSIDYWTEAVLLTTRDDYFGPTELCYLENRFYNIASEAKRYEVTNGNDPSPGNPTEEKICELEEFIEYSKLVIGAMGYKFLISIVPAVKKEEPIKEKEPEILYLNTAGVSGTGALVDGGFVLFKGGKLREKVSQHCPETVIKKRAEYADKIKDYVLQDDILFQSPSGAAGFLIATHISGYKVWKNKDGVTLGELLNK